MCSACFGIGPSWHHSGEELVLFDQAALDPPHVDEAEVLAAPVTCGRDRHQHRNVAVTGEEIIRSWDPSTVRQVHLKCVNAKICSGPTRSPANRARLPAGTSTKSEEKMPATDSIRPSASKR